jgi:hypothetical protein
MYIDAQTHSEEYFCTKYGKDKTFEGTLQSIGLLLLQENLHNKTFLRIIAPAMQTRSCTYYPILIELLWQSDLQTAWHHHAFHHGSLS